MLRLDPSVDRLAAGVSRALAEPRVAALRSELERLRLVLFFRTWGSERFKQSLIHANEALTRCVCLRCQAHGRHPTGIWLDPTDDGGIACEFLPWLRAELALHGLTTAHASARATQNSSYSEYIEAFDVPAHLYADEGGYFAVGALVWGARTADDPELRKYARFIESLEAIANDEGSGGRTSSSSDDDGHAHANLSETESD